MKKLALMGLFAFFVAACSSSSNSGSSGNSGNSAVTQPTCFDAAGKPTSSCALTPSGNVCSMGDASSCTPLTMLEVYADDGKNGVCLHLVFKNECQAEIFADTCIEHTGDSFSDGGTDWQCWTSSIEPTFAIDVSQCQATGNYFSVATTSSGQLDIDEAKCPAPTP
ncbi:MAG: hypothetical protein ACRELY_29195 [Polyangiaceae bacterium]